MANFFAIKYPERMNVTGQDLWQESTLSVLHAIPVKEQRKSQHQN